MASKNDGLAEILVQLASTSAQLIDRARASGVFKPAAAEETVTVVPVTTVAEAEPQTAALQAIIVQQAMKMHALEAEVDRLTAEVARLEALAEQPVKAAKPKVK